MKWIRTHRPSPAMAVALAALIVALGGAAFAAIPDSSGTIHGCAKKRNGSLRVVESAGDCRAGEFPISWNDNSGGRLLHFGPVLLPGGQHEWATRDFTFGPFTLHGECQLNNTTYPGSDWVRSSLSAGEGQGGGTYPISTRHGQPANSFGDLFVLLPDDRIVSGKVFAGLNMNGHIGDCVFAAQLIESAPGG